jgi:SAM-dependent methyltransferase
MVRMDRDPGRTSTTDVEDVNHPLWQFIPVGRWFDFATVPYFWNINGIVDLGSDIEVSGWALPHGGEDGGTVILINGDERGTIVREEADEVARLYPWWPNARRSQFRIRVPRAEFDLLRESEIEFCAVPRDPSRRHTNPYSALYLRPADLSANLPGPDLLGRIGADNSFHYALFGRTLCRQFERALLRVADAKLDCLRCIVDWGCSSGRVARHIVAALTADQRFVGFDIDAAAVAWARSHLGPHFSVCGRQPPLDMPAAEADLVYAYSVFTHLTRDTQKPWIDEIARILRPGGYFLFTILSDTAVLALSPYSDRDFLANLLASGIDDGSPNRQLEAIDVGADYYRNVWMTADYVIQNWQPAFEVLRIERNFHFYQDLVVCRRR